MGGYEFTPSPEKAPDTKPAFAGGPPQPPPTPPKLTAQDLLEPGGRRIFVSNYVDVRDLAGLLGVKPFKVVAELMALRIFKHADEVLDFSTAALLGTRHGFVVERLW